MGLLGALAQPSSLLPKLDRTTHNLKEAGWTGRQKGEAGVSNWCIQKASCRHWHEEPASSNPRVPSLLQPRAWPAALPTTANQAVCTDPVPLLIIAGLLEPSGSPWRPR